MTIFSIPVYDHSEAEYEKIVERERKKVCKNMDTKNSSDYFNSTRPNAYVWRNTIVGYIDVVYQRNELNYFIYEMRSKHFLPQKQLNDLLMKIDKEPISEEEKERKKQCARQSIEVKPYKMKFYTTKKHYMDKEQVGGFHSMVGNLSNEEIANLIENDIKEIIKEYFEKRYVDLEQFLNLYNSIDYKKVFTKYED